MWTEACELLEHALRLQRQFFTPVAIGEAGFGWRPPVDMYETATEICVTIALPGVNPGDLEIASEDECLIVAGRRRLPIEFRSARVHRIEIPQGLFQCSIALPATESVVAKHRIENGCLMLRIQKQNGPISGPSSDG